MTFDEWYEGLPSMSMSEPEFAKFVWDAAVRASEGRVPDDWRKAPGLYRRGDWTETRSGRHAVRHDDGLLIVADGKHYHEIMSLEPWKAAELAEVLAHMAADMPSNA